MNDHPVENTINLGRFYLEQLKITEPVFYVVVHRVADPNADVWGE